MKAYVITIEGHDKSEAAAHRCIKSGLKNDIKIEKFYAVTPKDNPKQIFKDRGYPLEYFTEEFSKSENTTSTFLSHLFLWEKAVELNEDVVIFEHDAIVLDKIPTGAIFKGCMTFSKPSYGNYNTPMHIGPGPLTQKPYFGGAHGYIVSPEGARRLIEKAPTHAGPADIYLNKNNFPWIEEYYPWACEAKDSFSTIQRTKGCLAKHNYNEAYELL